MVVRLLILFVVTVSLVSVSENRVFVWLTLGCLRLDSKRNPNSFNSRINLEFCNNFYG